MDKSSTAFSERYQAHVEAERKYVGERRKGAGKEGRQAPGARGTGSGIVAAEDAGEILTVEEAYRSIRAENRRKPSSPFSDSSA